MALVVGTWKCPHGCRAWKRYTAIDEHTAHLAVIYINAHHERYVCRKAREARAAAVGDTPTQHP